VLRRYLQDTLRMLLERRQNDAGKLFDSYTRAISSRTLPIGDLCKSQTLHTTLEDYRLAVESGSRNREAAFELALKSTTPFSVGDRVSYYISAGKGPSYDRARPASNWNPLSRDEDLRYYLKQLEGDVVLSLLRNVRHSYRPHTAVLVEDGGHWRATPAVPGALSGPGLVIFQFGADFFYANAGRFAADVRGLVEGAASPVNWLVVDAGAITSVDYSAARVLRDLQQDLIRRRIGLVLVHTESSLRADLRRHRLIDVIGTDHIFDTLHEALAALPRLRLVAKEPVVGGEV
jgi:hypothetical protein